MNTSDILRRGGLTRKLAEVAVSLPLSAKIPRDMRRGILRYARERGDWAVTLLEGRTYSQKIDDLKARSAAGFFGYVSTDEEAAVIGRLHIPCVLRELDSGRLPPKVLALIARSSSLVTDSAGMGRMAADYYLDSRYPTFAYVGEPEPLGWSSGGCRAGRLVSSSRCCPGRPMRPTGSSLTRGDNMALPC